MRTSLLAAVTSLGLLAGCDTSSPSSTETVYALARIGVTPLPIGTGTGGGPPFLIADSLRLHDGRPREFDGLLLSRVVVMQDAGGVRNRQSTQHGFFIQGDVLSYDSCPFGAACIASLVYAPVTFQIVGDSLFEIVPNASPLPAGRVYGRVPRR